MINALNSATAPSLTGMPSGRAELRPPAAGVVPNEPLGAPAFRTGEVPAALDRAAQAAAQAMFAEREVEVTSFHDQATGRIVCTVADRRSGEVLMQSPPDALLRFFASTRAMLTAPLLAVDA